jgi:DNA-3-methyladenine glycosylase II
MSLHFADIFLPGDLATVRAVYELGLMPEKTPVKEISRFMKKFEPYRSAATYLLWHYYLEKRNLEL